MNENKLYKEQMDIWILEQEALFRQLRSTIETSSEILELNKKQLALHEKRLPAVKAEFEQWKRDNGYSNVSDDVEGN
jgi:hypothetical protein